MDDSKGAEVIQLNDTICIKMKQTFQCDFKNIFIVLKDIVNLFKEY